MLDYQVLREIEFQPSHTQRSLAEHLGISLGKANYVLSGLARNGFIKAKRQNKNSGRIRWHYLLTTKGFEEKVVLAKKYLNRRLEEFYILQKEIEILQQEVNGKTTLHQNFR